MSSSRYPSCGGIGSASEKAGCRRQRHDGLSAQSWEFWPSNGHYMEAEWKEKVLMDGGPA